VAFGTQIPLMPLYVAGVTALVCCSSAFPRGFRGPVLVLHALLLACLQYYGTRTYYRGLLHRIGRSTPLPENYVIREKGPMMATSFTAKGVIGWPPELRSCWGQKRLVIKALF